MTTDATQQGVSDQQPTQNNRANAMAQIAKSVHEQNAADLRAFNEDTGEMGGPIEPTPEPEQKPAATTVQEALAEVDKPEPTQDQPPADDGFETIIVSGEERKVKREQLIDAGRRTLQKQAAADKALEEANETLRRAKAYEQRVLSGQPSEQDAGQYQQPSSDAANGFGQLAQQATPDQIGALIEQKLWLNDADKAVKRFQEEFKDIADDPYAVRIAVMLEDERLAKARAEGAPLGDPWEAYRKHGETVRAWLGKARPQAAPTVSADKADRKRDTVTVTGSTTRQPTPTQAKTPTTAEVIEAQRLARQKGRQIQPTR